MTFAYLLFLPRPDGVFCIPKRMRKHSRDKTDTHGSITSTSLARDVRNVHYPPWAMLGCALIRTRRLGTLPNIKTAPDRRSMVA